MAITLNQHRRSLTQTVIAKFSDNQEPKQGLAAFFPTVTSASKLLSIDVERNRQKVAVDVMRCTDPVRNIFSNSTEKIFQPPYYNEGFDFTACQRYEETFGSGNAPTRVDAKFLVNDASDNLKSIKNKIIRAIELQRSQVLQTGIVKLKNGDSIDFKRKAESIVAKTGTGRWSNPDADILGDLNAGMEFIRQEGLSGSASINVIFGSKALANFFANKKVKELADFRRINRVDLNMPQFNNVSGMVFHGQIATGDYVVNIWTYNSLYEDPTTGENISYIDPDNVVMIADDFVGKTGFAGVPAIMGDNVSGQFVAPMEGEFYVRDVIDQIKLSWMFMISSAPLAIPVSIDRLYTIKTD